MVILYRISTGYIFINVQDKGILRREKNVDLSVSSVQTRLK